MFPASLQHPYVPRGRRRGRNDPNSRDYICPCGKSYLSYPALFTHIKIKHNGRAPGQIIKPKTESTSKRGRPRQQLYDSQSDTNDIAANCIDRLCDFVTEFEKPDDQITRKLKDLYMKDAFYKVYVNYNPQEQEPVYNQMDDLYDEYCDNVFCQVIAQVNKRINQPYHIDAVIIFFMLMAHFINESSATQNIEQQRNQPNYGYGEYIQNEDENAQNQEYLQEAQNQQNEQELVQQEYIQPENENGEKGQRQNYASKSSEKIAHHEKSQQMNKNSQYVDDYEQVDANGDAFLKLKQQPIRNIVNYVNDFILKYTQKYYEVYNLKDSEFFFEDNIKAFIQLFFHWLTMKKYIGFKVKINKNYK